MRSSFPSATRNLYLGGTVAPIVRATLRRLRLDFGAALYVDNDGAVLGASEAGDDLYDPTGGVLRVLWGDSCVSDVSPYAKVRIVSPTAWTSGGSASLYVSRATAAADTWTLAALSPTGVGPGTLSDYTRLGLHPGGGEADASEDFYLWYLDSADDLYRIALTHTISGDAWAWGDKTTALEVGAYSGAAVHPVSETEAIVVGYDDPYLWVRYCKWNGSSWTSSTAAHVVHMSDELVYADAHWSDAVVSPADATKIVVAANLTQWGSAFSLLYDAVSGVWSQPREILPSAQDWGNLKVWVSGLSIINSRIWAVTVREPVGSNDIRMAHHVALASSPDGLNWRDEDFVTTSALRGKLLYRSGEEYCYAAGNASVARAAASNKLGHDNTSLKYQVNEASELTVTASGAGSAPEVGVHAQNDGAALSASGLLEGENELTVELSASGGAFGDYCKALLMRVVRGQAAGRDEIELLSSGYMSRVLGSQSYRPLAAKVYDGPYTLYSRFQFDTGEPRLTVRQQTGTWVAEKVRELGRYGLYCKKAGISLVPQSLASQTLVSRVDWKATVSIEGNYFVFWYEDESNYWQAGVYDDDGTQKVVVDRYVGGVKSNKARATLSAAVSAGNWYSTYLELKPGRVRCYVRRSDSHVYNSTTNSVAYDTTAESSGAPETHHLGLKVEAFDGWEGADLNGVVTAADSAYLEDSSEPFTVDVSGKWVRSNDQDRRIIGWETDTLYIQPPWAEAPEAGDEYGVYPQESKDGPGCYYKELWACEGIIPWTVDDVTDSILELGGVDRSAVYGGGDVPTLSASSPVTDDVDVKIVSAQSLGAATHYLRFWLSTTTGSGDPAFSGLLLTISSSWVFLYEIVAGSNTLAAAHPTMATLPTSTESREFRVQAAEDFIIVSCDGHFLTAFPAWGSWPGGYVAKLRAGDTATQTEFSEILDSFIWDANEPAASALSRLLRGRRAKVVERSDGSVAVSRFDSELGDLGAYTLPIVEYRTGESLTALVSLAEMVGAEEHAFYIDETAARKSLRYVRTDNPTLENQQATLEEARRVVILGRQRSEPGGAKFYAPDPALELEDQFTYDSDTYIVSGYSLSIRHAQASCDVAARAAPPAADEGAWQDVTDDDYHYDGGTEYGG